MAKLNGKEYGREALLRYCGSIDQIASIDASACTDGKAAGAACYRVKTGGGLEFDVLPNQCLDIASLRYKGVNLSFLAKNGIVGPLADKPAGYDFVRYVSGGMLFTCGLGNVGNGCMDGTVAQPLHGRIGLTPAQYPYAKCDWQGDDYLMEVGGTMHETALFGLNLILKRRIVTKLGSNEIEIFDTIENNNPTAQEFMFLYHVNYGFPFLDETLEVVFPENTITPRTEVAKADLDVVDVYTKPVDELFERVFFRDVVASPDGLVTVELLNRALGIGSYVTYKKDTLPKLTQWKSLRSGDYALGIEPSNCGVDGIAVEREKGTLLSIAPFSKVEYYMKLSFFDI
ncbi:MAG: aldose 1-epimerase family protein [Clostridia bacterium]